MDAFLTVIFGSGAPEMSNLSIRFCSLLELAAIEFVINLMIPMPP